MFLEVMYKSAVGVGELRVIGKGGGYCCGVEALGHVSYPIVKGQMLCYSIAILD